MTISIEERDFFVAMGERIAASRRASNVTQVQLAEALGVSQQTLQSYEVGRRRIPVSALQALAKALSVEVDVLLGDESAAKARAKRGPVPTLAQHMERISVLPKTQQKFVIQVIETVLAQQGR